jgi:hypothetical protein
LSTSDASLYQLPILSRSIGRELNYLRQHQLEITEQSGALRIVRRR